MASSFIGRNEEDQQGYVVHGMVLCMGQLSRIVEAYLRSRSGETKSQRVECPARARTLQEEAWIATAASSRKHASRGLT